jgi:hypothetical protein
MQVRDMLTFRFWRAGRPRNSSHSMPAGTFSAKNTTQSLTVDVTVTTTVDCFFLLFSLGLKLFSCFRLILSFSLSTLIIQVSFMLHFYSHTSVLIQTCMHVRIHAASGFRRQGWAFFTYVQAHAHAHAFRADVKKTLACMHTHIRTS